MFKITMNRKISVNAFSVQFDWFYWTPINMTILIKHCCHYMLNRAQVNTCTCLLMDTVFKLTLLDTFKDPEKEKRLFIPQTVSAHIVSDR